MTDGPSFFARLKAQASDEWRAYGHHAFVNQLGDGSLPMACFRHYLLQDYVFLMHFSRAWALAVYKAERLDDMRAAATTLNALLNHEMALHVAYGKQFGITPEQMEAVEEAPANLAYTRYVLERGMAGDLLDLHVALAPCVIGYGEIGTRLASEYAATLLDNPYREWIEMYSGDEYQQVVKDAIVQIDRLAAERATDARFASLCEVFRRATQLECDFWQLGLDVA